MPFAQPVRRRLFADGPLTRKVLVAVELFDPVAQSLVSHGVAIKARGIDGDPIVSWSGRFVWLQQADAWPTSIAIDPVRLPFAAQEVQTPRPPNFPAATAAERLVRIVLQPTPAYPFDGVTSVRGRLAERPDAGSPPMSDVRVQLAWFDLNAGAWVPAAPGVASDPSTTRAGDFAAFLRLMPRPPAEPDVERGFLRARLQFTTPGPQPESRATPDDYTFLPPDRAPAGRIPEGRLLAADLRLGWSALQPI
jgi:hypothetical protein